MCYDRDVELNRFDDSLGELACCVHCRVQHNVVEPCLLGVALGVPVDVGAPAAGAMGVTGVILGRDQFLHALLHRLAPCVGLCVPPLGTIVEPTVHVRGVLVLLLGGKRQGLGEIVGLQALPLVLETGRAAEVTRRTPNMYHENLS